MANILWIDDEIDLLRAHILLLEQKGYCVSTATNGTDAIEMVRNQHFDLAFLDENMPGLSGLETLPRLKEAKPLLPVVMVTKSEEENIMDQAVGAQIADYLIKPVNPMQVLLSIKKHLHAKDLISEKQLADYRMEFSSIGTAISQARSMSEWMDLHRKLVSWRLKMLDSSDPSVRQILEMQQNEANTEFSKYIKNNYIEWFGKRADERPPMSPNLMRNKVFPLIDAGQKVLFVLIDNLRYDQWRAIEPLLADDWRTETDELYCTILPTSTQYARNAIFAGLMPLEIQQSFPDLWVYDEEEEGKNQFEEQLLQNQLQRLGKNYTVRYSKGNTLGGQRSPNAKELAQHQLSVVVYNFVDLMSHARTDSAMMKQLASDESAYLSLTRSWFQHSDLRQLLKEAAAQGLKVVITTDHGTTRVMRPVKVVGDRATSNNLRYKLGKNLNYSAKEVFEIRNPEEVHLPKPNVSSAYIFAYGDTFMAYPNNYNHFVNLYRDTFQHGGISLDEMLVPIITLSPLR